MELGFFILFLVLPLMGLAFFIGTKRATQWRQEGKQLSSLPSAYGTYLVLQTAWPFFLCFFLLHQTGAAFYLTAFQTTAMSLGAGLGVGGYYFWRMAPSQPVRKWVERWIKAYLALAATTVILFAISIVLFLSIESLRFFQVVSLVDFLFGVNWDPMSFQPGSTAHFGALPLILGTLLITVIAALIAAPCGLFSAIYLSEYASKRFRHLVKPVLEMLAGIPTVVYGFFAATIVAPWLQKLGSFLGLNIAMESALAAGLVMGIMILPYILSLCDDILRSIPKNLREGALALGSTPSETIYAVVLPAAFPGIMASFLLGISRAIGETMLVVMAAGMTAHLTVNPFKSVTTVTVQIVTLLTGDQEPDSPQTLAAFALGLLLFLMTLSLNIVALRTVRKYRKASS
ncbi:MAG: phosphate ABC transporter permease subunit PstC [Alphaproteobacteria bacterium]